MECNLIRGIGGLPHDLSRVFLLLALIQISSSIQSLAPRQYTEDDTGLPIRLRNEVTYVDPTTITHPLGSESGCLVDKGRVGLICAGLNSHHLPHPLHSIRSAQLINCTLPLWQLVQLFPNLSTLSLIHSPKSFSVLLTTNTTPTPVPVKWEEVKVLNISWNGLEPIALTQLLPLFPNLRLLDISHNYVDQVEIDLVKDHPQLAWVDISDNPLDCTAAMEWLDDGQVTLLHPELTLCHSPPHQNKAKPIWKVRKLIKKVREECRGNCSCDITYIWEQNHAIHSKTTVNCSGRGFLDFPDPATLPHPTDTLDLSNNQIVSMRRFVEDERWEGLDVMNLHLDSNRLESIALLETSDWFYNFQIFTFRNNSVREVPVYVLENVFSHNKRILQIDLSLNPFHCDCTTLSTLKSWLLKHTGNIGHIEDVRCWSTGGQIRYLRHEDWCRVESVDSAGLIDLLDLISIFLALAILGVVSKVYYDYWNLKHNGKLPWVATKM